ncbi:MAG: hypothetical protein HC786_31430 [Richelia sp. CSU_2_1]|nr:hypothetical protein [Richelia sp. CSU_2_1]
MWDKSLVSIGPLAIFPERAIASKSIGIEESNYLKGSRNLDVAARVRGNITARKPRRHSGF